MCSLTTPGPIDTQCAQVQSAPTPPPPHSWTGFDQKAAPGFSIVITAFNLEREREWSICWNWFVQWLARLNLYPETREVSLYGLFLCDYVSMYLFYTLFPYYEYHATCYLHTGSRFFFCQILEFMIGTTPYRLSHFLFETMKQKQQIMIIINFFWSENQFQRESLSLFI